MGTPCLITLSRSTLMNCWGTLPRNVVLTPAISGRLRAAVRNVFKLVARNCTSLPARSSRTNVNPPEVPTPGMAGGGKTKSNPLGQLAEGSIQAGLYHLKLGFPVGSFVPRFQGDPKKCVVCRSGE